MNREVITRGKKALPKGWTTIPQLYQICLGSDGMLLVMNVTSPFSAIGDQSFTVAYQEGSTVADFATGNGVGVLGHFKTLELAKKAGQEYINSWLAEHDG